MQFFSLSIPLLVSTLCVLSTCSAGTAPDNIPVHDSIIPADSPIAITGVNLITMKENGVLSNRTIIIEQGRIQQVGKHGSLAFPDNAVVLEAGGRYMIPGLFDMHVHLHEEDLSRYLAHGITGVRNMWGHPAIKTMIEKPAINR